MKTAQELAEDSLSFKDELKSFYLHKEEDKKTYDSLCEQVDKLDKEYTELKVEFYLKNSENVDLSNKCKALEDTLMSTYKQLNDTIKAKHYFYEQWKMMEQMVSEAQATIALLRAELNSIEIKPIEDFPPIAIYPYSQLPERFAYHVDDCDWVAVLRKDYWNYLDNKFPFSSGFGHFQAVRETICPGFVLIFGCHS